MNYIVEDMRIVANFNGYNYWTAVDANGKRYYNVEPDVYGAPCSGYYDSEYICSIKGVPNLFNEDLRHE